MKIVIIGAGRMGVRHALGVKAVVQVEKAIMVDIKQEALNTAKEQIDDSRFDFMLFDDFMQMSDQYDIAIIASTANNRLDITKSVVDKRVKNIMLEKPLGQSRQEVEEIVAYAKSVDANIFVNLNMRMYENFNTLKEDLNTLPQFAGEKVITLNTGTIGIGANGIHYLDLVCYLLGASKAEIVAGEIEARKIPSGRGSEFNDYGGWCTIKYFDENGKYLGRAHLSMTSTSSVFGGWDIVGPHGRIRINEIELQRVDILRKADSELPVNRYAGDYLPPEVKQFESPFLGDLTRDWVKGIINGKELLPSVEASLTVHNLMFDWLEMSPEPASHFAIT